MAVKETREDDDEGRHTTTHRELILLPGGGVIIDTPGIRELQLWEGGGIDEAFSDLEDLALTCRFNDCSHTQEPGCAVLAAMLTGELASERFQSWRKLQRELRAIEVRHNARLRKEDRRKWQLITKENRARTRNR
jgi:ribosome biogenesis GTPase